MVAIEVRQMIPSDTASNGRNVVDVRLLYHRSHGLLNGPLTKFELGMFVPYGFKVKVRTSYQRLEERETPCMSNCGRCALEIIVSGDCEEWFEIRVFVMS